MQCLAAAPCTPLKEITISQVTFYLFQFLSFFFHLKYLKQVCIQTFTSSNFIHVLPLMCAALLARFNLCVDFRETLSVFFRNSFSF